MFRRPILLTLLLLVLPAAAARADRGGYVIDRFQTDLTVEPNSDLVVEERLEVVFTEPRHGIYRTIPIRYTHPMGYGYSLGFTLLSVTDGTGRDHGAKVSHQGRSVRIRIGDPDRTVQGPVVYLIRYRIRDAVQHFADHDELYWNATGHEWQTTIRRATTTVHLPGDVPTGDMEIAGFAGAFGSRSMNAETAVLSPGTVRFEAPGSLGPLEGLTVMTAWPHGFVGFPSRSTRILRTILDNWILLAPVIAFGSLWRRYRSRGRDPEGPAAVTVRYEPPEGVTPGEIGTLVDEQVDLRDITATVVDLAIRGHLVLRVEEKSLLLGLMHRDEIVFERKRDRPEGDLLLHERLILDGLFENGDRVTSTELKEEFYRHLPGIRDALLTHLTDRGYFTAKPTSVRNRTVGAGVLAALITGAAGLGWASLRGGVFPLAAVVPLLAAFLVLVLFVSFAPAMPRRTRKGVAQRYWSLGFQEFVERVERPRLEAAEARQAFESLLPYAMALGVTAKWARRFEGLYEGPAPAWFVGPHMGTLSSIQLEQSLSSSMTQVGQNLAASPRSSGSGGGGFSGGGGGGGGGGSW